MSKHGMGAIYTRTCTGEALRAPLNAMQRQYVLDRWYWPHHLKLERKVNEVIAQVGTCLIIDCHSFPAIALPCELDQSADRPDICIGTDPFHTAESIRDALLAVLKEIGFSAAVDFPFTGALVPATANRKDSRISLVMIDVNRRLYMDERSGLKTERFEKVRSAMKLLITTAAESEHNRHWTMNRLSAWPQQTASLFDH